LFLEETSLWLILLPFVAFMACAYISAVLTANTYDFRGSVKIYLPACVVVVVVSVVFGLPFVLACFMAFSGFVSLVFFSNKIFYTK